MNNILGIRLRERRNLKGITQEELGRYIGVQKAAVQKYESGQRQPPAKTLSSICDILECTSDYLIGRADNPNGVCYQYEDNDLGLISMEYPEKYNVTKEELKLFIEELKSMGCDVDALFKKVKNKTSKEEWD